MCIVYLYIPLDQTLVQEGDIFIDSGDWSECGFVKSESLWIVPGTIDPKDD